MQGWNHFIPTQLKVGYLNALLKVGFDVLDFGSFVSPKHIPQLADTAQVLEGLELSGSNTQLLAIIANTRGAEDACRFAPIRYLGFPFSISETFQLRNTNKTIAQSLTEVEEIQNLCVTSGKEMVVYISMGFGNPYGDAYDAEVAVKWVARLAALGIKTISLADTVGVAQPDTIKYLFDTLIPEFPGVEIGAHFHSAPAKWEEKVAAAYASGCRRFDSALKGIGGCPFAEDELVGNIATENVLDWCERNSLSLNLNRGAFMDAMTLAGQVFH
jgi:hydroxymethylglutaryl-CoA lyase